MATPQGPVTPAVPAAAARSPFVPADFARALVIACDDAGCPLPAAVPEDHASLNAAGAAAGLDKKTLADALWRAQMEKLSSGDREELGLTGPRRTRWVVGALVLATVLVGGAVLFAVLFAQRDPPPDVTGDIDEVALTEVIDALTEQAQGCVSGDVAMGLAVGLRIGTESQLLDVQVQGDEAFAACARDLVSQQSWPAARGAPVDVAFTLRAAPATP